jgi:glycosyltransferase involved in cell wall biosynthesis
MKNSRKINLSIIQPSRNNLKYLKWSYESIRKNQGDHNVQICVADDASTDGTWEWCKEMMNKDDNFNAIRNEGPNRLGHTILYDKLVNEVANHEYCMIYHADMYLAPGAIDAIADYAKPQQIVSLTRIEPPLHPDGPEKVLKDFGTEPETFDEKSFLDWLSNDYQPKHNKDFTFGVFAPWCFYKKDFQDIGGHDPLYAPQSKEDSDIFNRFKLNDIQFIQTWKGVVYHMTCRGSRFNPTITTVGTASTEWQFQNIKSSRNFIRKWGHFVKHDEFMMPIVPSKYKVTIKLINCKRKNILAALEPWCTVMYTDFDEYNRYIESEQKLTSMDMSKRLLHISEHRNGGGVELLIDCENFSDEDFLAVQELSTILDNAKNNNNPLLGEKFSLGNIQLDIFDLNTYERELINL